MGSSDGSLYALDAISGSLKWKYSTGNAVFSSPMVSGGLVVFGSLDNQVYALDALTGEKVWSYTTGAGVASSPNYSNGVVYVGSNDLKVYALSLQDGKPDLELHDRGPSYFPPRSCRWQSVCGVVGWQTLRT